MLMNRGRYRMFSAPGKPLVAGMAELPVPGRGEVLVRNEYTTLCRSDLNTYIGKRKEQVPTILGHEIVGRIVAKGPDAPDWDLRGQALAPGSRITWGIYASDPAAALSQRGIPQKAPSLFKYGHEQLSSRSGFHGGLASHILLRAHTPMVRVDEAVPLPVAALINCAMATVAGAFRLAGLLAEETLVVSGAGMLGLVACAMGAEQGAEVIAVEVDPARLETARRFGATQGFEPRQVPADLRAAAVLELSGVPAAMEQSLSWLGIGGTAVWVGGTHPQRPLQVDAEAFIRNLSLVKGLHNYNAQDLLAAVEFIEQFHDSYPFHTLIHNLSGLDQAEAAFQYALKHNPFRVGLRLNA